LSSDIIIARKWGFSRFLRPDAFRREAPEESFSEFFRMLLESAFRFGALLDAAQLMAPIAFKFAAPLVHRPDGLRVGAVKHASAVAPNANQADVAEDAKVLRNRWLPDAHGRDNFSHRALLEHKKIQDFAPAGFRHGVKGVRSGGSARHDWEDTFLCGNMSSFFLPAALSSRQSPHAFRRTTRDLLCSGSAALFSPARHPESAAADEGSLLPFSPHCHPACPPQERLSRRPVTPICHAEALAQAEALAKAGVKSKGNTPGN
jgi:hypothetical protein